MKYSSKILSITLALLAVVVFASSTDARKVKDKPGRTETRFVRVPDERKPDGFELRESSGQVVGVTSVSNSPGNKESRRGYSV
jgi:hypothetical protein